ncbi:MAG: hypothetical protein HN878_00825, partial [Candidatus Diapherotrites archaeon]|nr:hypothetical protein [Candidatus Diapherotrites archaeon]
MLEKVKQLSKIEREVLAFLGEEERSILELAKGSSVGIDSVRRAVAWLNEKGLAKVEEKESENLSLTKEGKEALTKGMPENIFLETLTKLGGKASFSDLQKETALSQNAFTAALGINKRKAFIIIAGGEIEETGVAKEQESFDVRNLLQDVVDQKTIEVEKIIDLSKRGLVEKKSSTERTAKITKEGLEAKKLLSEKKIERV